ncbi:hypothetical protein PMI01_00947 [Caulobacter sp. AP07]|uniref:hypothetical protein n=1 Tax=Caulobacter sp. AP07 TaxID=1144304 RepID=UPI0002721AD0|nr:hypothetical protein [Caulobacter sp. AP07]EJL36572.1 hypothetical protein PMI01_00947 [Caulobacter sp. AP07]
MSNGKSYVVAKTFTNAAGEQRVVLRGFSGTFGWSGEPLNEGDRIHLTEDGRIVRSPR